MTSSASPRRRLPSGCRISKAAAAAPSPCQPFVTSAHPTGCRYGGTLATAVMALVGENPVRATATIEPDVALAARGDSSAFERLYRTHVARIHSLTRRMLGAHEADEATQDVFVRTWQKLGQFRGDSAFGTWLHRLAINVV